jgi:hypothetical protein
MIAKNVIVIDDLEEREERSIVNKSINYALISISYTYNRMDLDKLGNRIQNITKGKIAEYIFQHYLIKQKTQVDF